MTLRLAVDSSAWRRHVRDTIETLGDVLPVVKGNGYGFGRRTLMSHAAELSADVAVGTVHELADVPTTMRPFVLTPVGRGVVEALGTPNAPTMRPDAVFVVASQRDLQVLAQIGGQNPVVIKVESSMHRYGISPSQAAALRASAEAAGHPVVAWSVHLPLTGDANNDEAVAIAAHLTTDLPLHVSHLQGDVGAVRRLLKHRLVVRTGTQLWLGDKSTMSLHADVVHSRPVSRGSTAGYRNTPITHDGSLLLVGCGTANGVGMLEDGRSPFHFSRLRLDLLEPPHMHTTMLFVGHSPCPHIGDWVDVQQPLTRVLVDDVFWQ